ncbi:MAG: hypothetical protein V3V10_10815, partial [Planctomycetota bacterium]
MTAERPARVVKWRGEFYVFFKDYTQRNSKGEAPNRRLTCKSLGANNKVERKDLVDTVRLKQKTAAAKPTINDEDAYDVSLTDELERYLRDVERRALARKNNPEARRGLAHSTVIMVNGVVRTFAVWLQKNHPNITTGKLAGNHLVEFIDWYAGDLGTSGGKKTVQRSKSTINIAIRNVKTCLNWIDDLEPPRFKNARRLLKRLKPIPNSTYKAQSYSPDELRAYLSTFIEYEDPHR